MHGLGNDFILLSEERIANLKIPELARKICHRNIGIGADGVIILGPTTEADIRIRIFNPDGTESSMCANGIRCTAINHYQSLGNVKKIIYVQTAVGIVPVNIHIGEDDALIAALDMGWADFSPDAIPMITNCYNTGLFPLHYKIDDKEFDILAVNIGVPHGVILVDNLDSIDVAYWGARLETAACFPARANINFVQIESRTRLRVRTWERGAGLVKACGSGACAALVITAINDLTEAEATIQLELGELRISYSESYGVKLSGPAMQVFEGYFPYN